MYHGREEALAALREAGDEPDDPGRLARFVHLAHDLARRNC